MLRCGHTGQHSDRQDFGVRVVGGPGCGAAHILDLDITVILAGCRGCDLQVIMVTGTLDNNTRGIGVAAGRQRGARRDKEDHPGRVGLSGRGGERRDRTGGGGLGRIEKVDDLSRCGDAGFDLYGEFLGGAALVGCTGFGVPAVKQLDRHIIVLRAGGVGLEGKIVIGTGYANGHTGFLRGAAG